MLYQIRGKNSLMRRISYPTEILISHHPIEIHSNPCFFQSDIGPNIYSLTHEISTSKNISRKFQKCSPTILSKASSTYIFRLSLNSGGESRLTCGKLPKSPV